MIKRITHNKRNTSGQRPIQKNDDENSIFLCIWNDMYVDFFLLQKKLNDRQVMALTSRGLMNSLLVPLVALGKG